MEEIKETKAVKPAVKKAETAAHDVLNDKVTFKLFKDTGKYKDDLYVAVNGRRWRIKRGVDVTVPRYVFIAVQRSLNQDEYTAEVIDSIKTV